MPVDLRRDLRATDLSDHPTAPGRGRDERRADATGPTGFDSGRRPPARPERRAPRPADLRRAEATPMSRRPPVPPAGPRTTAAPFRAVPQPESQPDKYSPERLAGPPVGAPAAEVDDERWPMWSGGSSRPAAPTVPADEPRRRQADRDPDDLRRDADPRDGDRSAPWTTEPRQRLGDPAGQPPPGVPAYGDWTKPSRESGPLDGVRHSRPVPPVPVPGTTAIPERTTARRDRSEGDDRLVDAVEPEVDAAEPEDHDGAASAPLRAGNTTTRVVGGRAALRAERQAADERRRKEERKRGLSPAAVLAEQEADMPEIGRPRRRRRLRHGLVAVVVLALGLLGAYAYLSPNTRTASSSRSAAATATKAPDTAIATATLPPLVTGVPSVEAAPATPVRVPVTVLNATQVNGLAAKIGAAFTAGGWQTAGVGAYKGSDVATTTVFFTQGNEQQRQAAVQLVNQFPKLSGPAPRFFDVPGNADPGLVVVATGEWRP